MWRSDPVTAVVKSHRRCRLAVQYCTQYAIRSIVTGCRRADPACAGQLFVCAEASRGGRWRQRSQARARHAGQTVPRRRQHAARFRLQRTGALQLRAGQHEVTAKHGRTVGKLPRRPQEGDSPGRPAVLPSGRQAQFTRRDLFRRQPVRARPVERQASLDRKLDRSVLEPAFCRSAAAGLVRDGSRLLPDPTGSKSLSRIANSRTLALIPFVDL